MIEEKKAQQINREWKTKLEQEAWNEQAYGDAEFPRRIAELIEKPEDAKMIAMSQLSDAQEEIERIGVDLGMKERARQTINRAKHIIDRYLRSRFPSHRKQPDKFREELIEQIVDAMHNRYEGGLGFKQLAEGIMDDVVMPLVQEMEADADHDLQVTIKTYEDERQQPPF